MFLSTTRIIVNYFVHISPSSSSTRPAWDDDSETSGRAVHNRSSIDGPGDYREGREHDADIRHSSPRIKARPHRRRARSLPGRVCCDVVRTKYIHRTLSPRRRRPSRSKTVETRAGIPHLVQRYGCIICMLGVINIRGSYGRHNNMRFCSRSYNILLPRLPRAIWTL